MFEESPFLIDVLASATHKGNCFKETVAEPLATIKGDYEFSFPLQNLKEIILGLNGYEEEVMSKMDDWPNGSTSTFPMSLVGLKKRSSFFGRSFFGRQPKLSNKDSIHSLFLFLFLYTYLFLFLIAGMKILVVF